MLSKSLIQFSVDGWSCVPSLLFTWGQTIVEVVKIMETSFKSPLHVLLHSVPSTLQQATTDPHLHLTCLLRYLYAGQEATVRTRHGTTDWFQIRKGVSQVCILSPCLFNSYEEYIMRNAGLDEAQAGIKIARRNINNLR